jgi:hypothetical protein
MPDKKIHQLAGGVVGVGFAALEAKNQPTNQFCIEMIGGGIGGYVAGMLPDVLEPAISSWHRGVCHSATAGAAVYTLNQLWLSGHRFAGTTPKNVEEFHMFRM